MIDVGVFKKVEFIAYAAYRDALSYRHTDWPTEPTFMVNLFRSYSDRHKL